jgi:seryl-tRNA synthetase
MHADPAAASWAQTTPSPGIVLSTAPFEHVIGELRTEIDDLVVEAAPVTVIAPPVISRDTIERAGYVESFPHLLGTIHNFDGDNRDWGSLRADARPGGSWHRRQGITDVVLAPAACYHIYPLLADKPVNQVGTTFVVECYCYRHEPTAELGRLRAFRMRELVYFGSARDCSDWRDHWLDRTRTWLTKLDIAAETRMATDPFFGPGAALMRQSQTQQSLKLELVAPVSGDQQQAVISGNYHRDHFGQKFRIRTSAQRWAHSACIAFGLERLALAVSHARRA